MEWFCANCGRRLRKRGALLAAGAMLGPVCAVKSGVFSAQANQVTKKHVALARGIRGRGKSQSKSGEQAEFAFEINDAVAEKALGRQ